MKIKKIAVLTASIIVALAAALGTIYGYCALKWELDWYAESVSTASVPDFDLVCWKFSSFQEYLVAPIHWFAVLLFAGVYLFFILVIFDTIVNSIISKYDRMIKEEKSFKKELLNLSDDNLREIQLLNRRLDHIPPSDKSFNSQINLLASKRLEKLRQDMVEYEFQLKCIDARICIYTRKIDDLKDLEF